MGDELGKVNIFLFFFLTFNRTFNGILVLLKKQLFILLVLIKINEG